jgi:transcriptional regulator with XRE-family HTH domain
MGINFLLEHRLEKGKTKADMARDLGVTHQTYSYYEREARGMSFYTLCRVQNLLGLSDRKLMEAIRLQFGPRDRRSRK